MPANTGKSQFAAKMGNHVSQAITEHAGDETEYGVIRVPAGITNGYAQLVDCYFGEYQSGPNKGKFFWRAAASILKPDMCNTPNGPMKVQGLQTQQMLPACETKTSAGKVTPVDEHIARIMNEMRKLGADTSTCTTASDLENISQMLKETKPVFIFSTSVRKGQMWNGRQQPDGVWENWNGVEGVVLSDIPDARTTEVRDTTGTPTPSTNGTGSHTNAWSDSMDLDALLAAVSGDTPDVGACDRIKELGVAVGGMSDEDVERDDVTWEDIVNRVREATTATTWECKKGANGYVMIWNPVSKKTDKGVSIIVMTDPVNGKVKVSDITTGKELINPATKLPMGFVEIGKIQADPF